MARSSGAPQDRIDWTICRERKVEPVDALAGREALSTFGATFETGMAEDDSAVAACPEFIWPGYATGAIIFTAVRISAAHVRGSFETKKDWREVVADESV